MNDTTMKKALAEYAASAGVIEVGKRYSSFAEILIEDIQPNRITLDFFRNVLMPTRVLNPGDVLVKRVRRRGVPVRTMVPGTEHLASQLPPPSEVMSFGIDYLIAKVRYNLWELRRGEIGTVQTFRQEMADSLMDALVSRTFTLLSTVWSATNTPNNYLTQTSAVSIAGLDSMIEAVIESAGSVRSIVGTRKALQPIYKTAGVVEHVATGGTAPTNTHIVGIQSVLEEWSRTNRLTSYRGIPLIELPQVFERSAGNWNKKLIPEDIVLVIGDKPGEIVLYGQPEYQEHVDTSVEPPMYSFAMYLGWGMIIDYPENIGVIKIV